MVHRLAVAWIGPLDLVHQIDAVLGSGGSGPWIRCIGLLQHTLIRPFDLVNQIEIVLGSGPWTSCIGCCDFAISCIRLMLCLD